MNLARVERSGVFLLRDDREELKIEFEDDGSITVLIPYSENPVFRADAEEFLDSVTAELGADTSWHRCRDLSPESIGHARRRWLTAAMDAFMRRRPSKEIESVGVTGGTGKGSD